MMVQRNVSPTSSGSRNKASKKPTYGGDKLSTYSLTLKMDKLCSSELHCVTIKKTALFKYAEFIYIHITLRGGCNPYLHNVTLSDLDALFQATTASTQPREDNRGATWKK
jgi:hypothetical protein